MTDLLSDFLSRREAIRRDLAEADEIERTINDWPEEFRSSRLNIAACLRMGVEFQMNPPPFVSYSVKPLTMEEEMRNALESLRRG